MIIVCTRHEKEKFIEVLSDIDTPCLFNPLDCREGMCCQQCLEDNINWVVKGGLADEAQQS